MRILVYPARMEIGGSQMNALELARDTARRGHSVTIFGPDGDLVSLAKEWGLEWLPAPQQDTWPGMRNVRKLTSLVRYRSIDVVHAYEWGPAMEAAVGPHLRLRTPTVVTVLSMDVPRLIPRHLPMVVGTAQLFAEEKERRNRLHLMEPPIDTLANAPFDPAVSRSLWGFATEEVVLAIVCRLVPDLGKIDGVLDAIDVVADLAQVESVRLLVAGGGPGLVSVRERAESANARLGRDAIIVQGPMVDPRHAYNAADIVLGMGSSALKGLAFAKPLVVQGERGYWRLLDEATLETFTVQGWYGSGGAGPVDLRSALGPLLGSQARREQLGAWGRRIVVEDYALEAAAASLEKIYETALSGGSTRRETVPLLASSGIELAKLKGSLWLAGASGRRRGR